MMYNRRVAVLCAFRRLHAAGDGASLAQFPPLSACKRRFSRSMFDLARYSEHNSSFPLWRVAAKP